MYLYGMHNPVIFVYLSHNTCLYQQYRVLHSNNVMVILDFFWLCILLHVPSFGYVPWLFFSSDEYGYFTVFSRLIVCSER